MTAISLVQDLLRSPDELKAVLEVTQSSPTGQELFPDAKREAQHRRVLAVVSHKDDWDLTEEGSLFICKYKSTVHGQPEELDVQSVFPIYGDFKIVISQTRRETLDLRPSTATKSVLGQPRAVMSLSVTPAEGLSNDTHAPAFFTYDVQGLKVFMAEWKRLREVSDVDANAVVNLAQSTTHFSWLKPYLAKRTTISVLTFMPQDLRQINQPLQDRLSIACAGLTADDHADVQVIRDDWILKKAKEMSRKGRSELTLRIGTFNVNGKMPTQDLSAWIQGNSNLKQKVVETESDLPTLPPVKSVSPLSIGEVAKNPFDWIKRKAKSIPQPELQTNEESATRVDLSNPDDPDILVLGFQELDLSTEALLYSSTTVREDAWCHAIFAALGEKAVNYEKLVSKQLVGMLILIIVKKSLKDCFKDVKTSAAGAGILGVMGNKGGTAIRLAFTPPLMDEDKKTVSSSGPTTFTFVNAHLAAFDEMFEKRNLDFQDLSKRLGFENSAMQRSTLPASSDPDNGNEPYQSPDMISINAEQTPPLTVYETDILFWMVNLNYRLDASDHDVRRTLRNEDWETGPKFEALLRFDQLKNAMNSKKAFAGFKELPITHLPTYRFSPGLMMDKLGYDMKRKPAWTDRILYMHGPACQVKGLSYTGHPQITMSDHRPVAADFAVDIDLYDTEEHHAYIRKLFDNIRPLDSEGSLDRRGLQIQDTFVDFDKLHYGQAVKKTIVVRNVSKSPCAFRFVPIQIDSPIHPEWLQISPMTGVLLPNEDMEITLRAEVDNATASILNLRPKDLSGTLILHTVLGKDHFISVSGEYQYTCFANKLSRLTRLRGPIRLMGSPGDLLPENNAINAPREIMRLVNWMMVNTANTDFIFLHPGKETDVNAIRECLDDGADFPYPPETLDPEIPLAFATTLLQLLDSLPEPIVPASLHRQCLEMTNRDEAFELLDDLPPVSINVWISVTAFLHFICKSAKDPNQAEKIASILAPVLLRDDLACSTLSVPPKGKCRFLLYFIS